MFFIETITVKQIYLSLFLLCFMNQLTAELMAFSSVPTHSQTNMVNIIPAKHQHASVTIMNMVM